ncbi:uncharacterized protein LOC108096032 [Drosophila ficusphila]|uniref:uncharacterized protein LOC108096032 n=1 Tax=Drosophila ficusphila TaxID=30025 RepID=UPI0007E731C5|nr:uncharacterized protein LOC108096032 [Drosophila ficusphila]
MLRFLILLGTGVLLGIYILGTQADCNVCASTTNVACISNTSFQYCDSSALPFGPVYSCPTGYYCTANDVTCDPNVNLRSCIGCGTCNSNNTFACITARIYALCLGTTTPSQILGSCGVNYVCDFNNPNICGSPSAGSQATCPGDTGTGDATGVSPTTYCATVQQHGRFPYGTDLNTTCRQYIYCFLNATYWRGGLYDCPGQTYFNSSSRYCDTEVPARCTYGVATLSLIIT